MKILVCDDDKLFVNKISEDIACFFKEKKFDVHIIKINNNFEKIIDQNVDIIFIDIDLITVNGIELARKIKNKFPNILIVFISARNDLVFDTLSLGIFQFIRKNKYDVDLKKTLLQLNDNLTANNRYMLLEISKRKVKIMLKDIVYIMSIGSDVLIKCYENEYSIRATLPKIIGQLNCTKFIQIQRNVLVNFDQITEFEKWNVKCGNYEFTIGRKYQKVFLIRYEEYLVQ